MYFIIVPTVSFLESTYSIAENNGIAQVVLVLSKLTAIDINVQVIDDVITAMGKWTDYDCNVSFTGRLTNN